MLNRSKLIGAKMVFNSEPGKGTVVNMEVPLLRKQNKDYIRLCRIGVIT